MSDGSERAAALAEYHQAEVVACTRCPLHETRTQVVAGSGNPNAQIMFVGEAPGYHEDKSGIPFVGAAGKLLDKLLEGIGLERSDVFIANVLKCRPPGNRDPLQSEIEACERHLFRQVGIIGPKVICTLGNFSTKLISGRPDGISRVHGCELPIEIGGRSVLLYPIYHPAAALYTPAMLATLEQDFRRIPELAGLATTLPPAAPSIDAADLVPDIPGAGPVVVTDETAESTDVPEPAEPEQLGLF